MITSSENSSFLPSTLLYSSCQYQQENSQHLCPSSTYRFRPSHGSYAILPLSLLPLSSSLPSPSELIQEDSSNSWTCQPYSDTRGVISRKRNHLHHLSGPIEQQPQEQKQQQRRRPRQRAKLWQQPIYRRPNTLTKTVWADEGTVCYQIEVKGICVTRRGDNSMVNGTKLLNAVGMSRGKRDGILKNVQGRRVVKVGSMVLKGVWIAIEEARELATKFVIQQDIYPLLEPCPDRLMSHGPLSLLLPSSSPSLSSSPSDTAADPGNLYSYSQSRYPEEMPSAGSPIMGRPQRRSLSPVPRQIGYADDVFYGSSSSGSSGGGAASGAERDCPGLVQHSSPPLPLSAFSSTASFTRTESVATETSAYNPVIQTPLPPVSYFQPYMMYDFLPKYSATTAYNEYDDRQHQHQQHEQQQISFNDEDLFLA